MGTGGLAERLPAPDMRGFGEWLLVQPFSRSTREHYLGEIARLHRWCHAHRIDPARVTAAQLLGFASTRPATWSTRHLIHNAAAAWCGYLERTDEPYRSVRRGRRPELVCKGLEDDDAAAKAWIIARAPVKQRAALSLGLYQAMRREEIARLAWWQIERTEFREIVILGKGSTQLVRLLHPIAAAALRELREVTPGEWCFPGSRGRAHINPSTVWAWSRRWLEIPPHVLRHTAAAIALERTEDLRAVQEYMRHARPETTAGYTRASRRRQGKVLAVIDFGLPRQGALFDRDDAL